MGEDISEDDRFDLLHLHLVCRNPVKEFLLQGGEEAFHPSIVEAVVYTAETLLDIHVRQRLSKCFAGVLASAVAMQDRSL